MIKKLSLAILSVALLQAAAIAQTFPGNGGGGFGSPIGAGSLNFSISGTTVTGTLTNGNTTSGFNDCFVIYIDSVAGGVTDTTTFTDTGDYNRRGISGLNGGSVRAPFAFSSGFAPDFAISLSVAGNGTNGKSNFGGLWSLSDPTNFPFVADVTLTPNNNTAAASYTFSFSLTNIGLTAGQSFKITTTYLDANNSYRSNESIGNGLSGTAADANGNFGQNLTTATGFVTVPEPSSLALLAASALFSACFLRRKRANF